MSTRRMYVVELFSSNARSLFSSLRCWANSPICDPIQPTVLVLAWNMQAKESATFTKAEFIAGCQKLGYEALCGLDHDFCTTFPLRCSETNKSFSMGPQCPRMSSENSVDSVDALKNKWPTFKTVLSTTSSFKDVYKFTFNYMKEDPGHKTVNLEIAKAYLALLLSDRPHIKSFLEYLDQQTEYRGLNADQWMTLLDFITNVNEDLSNYDENAAWPVVLDAYVEWRRKKNAAGSENNAH